MSGIRGVSGIRYFTIDIFKSHFYDLLKRQYQINPLQNSGFRHLFCCRLLLSMKLLIPIIKVV
jgi:hypothetical protein